ncbi:GerMN domain-containing protein [Fervidibacillus albus]|uniref:GerMN domain-containing protein n=1 Tax=Fervidibacillus albus TaxID=2980026 RepID=A0A9E8LWS2_9BACI|nr:GerMN domain-containing protein [Fervidibacillus albus]WAA10526.1 GerMN domain-containing protein [Fervidibacillus albus]
MVKNDWNDEEFSELFKQFPVVTDHRSRNELYSNVMDRLKQAEHRKKRRLYIPALATAAVLFLSIVLFMSIVRSPEWNMGIEQEAEEFHLEMIDPSNGKFFDSSEDFVEDEREKNISSIEKFAVYPDMIAEDELAITLYVPDKNAQNMVPVTVLEKQSDEQTPLDIIRDVMNRIDETGLGLSDYYPYNGTVSLDENGNVSVDLSENVNENWGSTGEILFMKSLESFRSINIDSVYLSDEGSPGLYFPHSGLEIFKYELGKTEENYAFFIYRTDDHIYLTSGPDTYSDLIQAFAAMKEKNEVYDLEPSIPSEMEITVQTDDNGLLVLRFSDSLSDYDGELVQLMIEAILLTANSFGFSEVQFENVSVEQNIGFEFEQPIPVPIAPNLVELPDDSTVQEDKP